MIDIFLRIWKEVKIICMDCLFALGIGYSVHEWIIEALHILTAVTATVLGGSILYLFQKTILPLIANWINKKFEKWFNKGTKIDNKE
jgi:hypothetical protein